MNQSDLTSHIDAVVDQTGLDLGSLSPFLGSQVLRWIRQISPHGKPSAHFLDVRMFPILQLPHYVAESFGVTPDAAFQRSLISSTVHGYYYIRLIDNVVDRDRDLELERTILPVAGYFCSEFQLGYQRHFSLGHPFWPVFREMWAASAVSSAEDAALRTVSRADFDRVASRKYSAAGIPVVATCHYYGRADLLPPWLELVNGLGRWSQMVDDILDWRQDSTTDRSTYFLSEGERQKLREESLEDWILREGCDWGFKLLNEWMAQLQQSATRLGSPGLREYLARRMSWLKEQHSVIRNGLAALADLAAIFDQAASAPALVLAGHAEPPELNPQPKNH